MGFSVLDETDKIFKQNSQNSSGPKYVSIKGKTNEIIPNGTSNFHPIQKTDIDFGGPQHLNGTGLKMIADSKSKSIYVLDNETDSVTLINTTSSDWKVEKTLQVGESPNNIAIDSHTNKMYVTSGQDILHPLVVINLNSKFPNTIKVGTQPSGIAVDPKNQVVYVANFGSDDISKISTGGNSKKYEPISLKGKNVSIYKGSAPLTSTEAKRASGSVASKLTISNTSSFNPSSLKDQYSLSLISRVPESNTSSFNPSSVTVNPNTSMVYVANFGNNTVSVINDKKDKQEVMKIIPVGIHPTGIAVDTKTETVYVANEGDNSVSVLDIKKIVFENNTSYYNIQTIPLGKGKGPVDVAVNPYTDLVYVANFLDNSISVIGGKAEKKEVINTIFVGQHPSSIAINPDQDVLDVAEAGSNSMSTVYLKTKTSISEVNFRGFSDIDQMGNCGEVKASNSVASGYIGNDKSENTIDGNRNTSWTNYYPSWILFGFKKPTVICNINIGWNYDRQEFAESPYKINISYSNSSNSNFKNVTYNSNIITTQGGASITYDLNKHVNAKYMKINVTHINNKIRQTPSQKPGTENGGLIPLKINSSEAGGITQLDIGLPSPVGIAFDDKANMIYLGSKKYNWVSQVNDRTNTILSPMLAGELPVALAVDPNNGVIYVANWGSNTVSIINGTITTKR